MGQNGKERTLTTLLKPGTNEYLRKLREHYDQIHYPFSQIRGDPKERINRPGTWSNAFLDRMTGFKTLPGLQTFLQPWLAWKEAFDDLFHDYHEDGSGDYAELCTKWEETEIPAGLKDQVGELTEKHFISNAQWYLFKVITDLKEAIDMLEGLEGSVSSTTIFSVQRITGQPLYPYGGLQPDYAQKPDWRRTEVNGQMYVGLWLDSEPPGVGYPDNGDEIWERWSQIEVGTHVTIVETGSEYNLHVGVAGTVYGYDIMGVGDLMLFQPSLAHSGLLIRDDQDKMLMFAMVEQVRLDSEI